MFSYRKYMEYIDAGLRLYFQSLYKSKMLYVFVKTAVYMIL